MIDHAKNILKKTIMSGVEMSSQSADALIEEIPIRSYKKGDILLHQGDHPSLSFYVIIGCVRQFLTDQEGKEVTVDFYTESAPINMISYSDAQGESRYSLSCIEDSVLVVCPHFEMSDLQDMTPKMSQMIQGLFYDEFTQLQHKYAQFKMMTPEARFLYLKNKQSGLMNRVPQHILASYLDITPETFSRFKKKHMSK